MVDEARRFLRNVGQVNQLGRSFSWVANPGTSTTHRNLEVVVSIRGGHTRITGIGGGMGGGGMGPIMGIFVGALNCPAAAIAMIVPLWLAATYATARTAYRLTARRRVQELEQLASRLAAPAQELMPPPRPALPGPA